MGLSGKVEEARRVAGFTVEELADATDISTRTLRRRLGHPQGFTLDELIRIADATQSNHLADHLAALLSDVA
jgi:uncharacterized protein (DUF2384 family)